MRYFSKFLWINAFVLMSSPVLAQTSGMPTGTAGLPNANVLTIQGISNGTSLPIVGTTSVTFNETTAALAASATFTPSTSRDSGAAGVASPWNTFSCFVRADQAGTINMQASVDNSNWYTEISQAFSANASLSITNRLFVRYHRCQEVNGSTAQTINIVNSQLGG